MNGKKMVYFFICILILSLQTTIAQNDRNVVRLQFNAGINNKIVFRELTFPEYYKQEQLPSIFLSSAFNLGITNKMFLNCGLTYINNKYEEEIIYLPYYPDITGVKKNSIFNEHILAIPVTAGYKILNQKLILSVESGITVSKIFSSNEAIKQTYPDGSIKEREVSHDVPKMFNFFLNFQSNLMYGINEKIAMGFTSSIMYNLDRNEIEKYLFLLNSIGITYKLN